MRMQITKFNLLKPDVNEINSGAISLPVRNLIGKLHTLSIYVVPKPIRMLPGLLSRCFMWIDKVASRPYIRPFAYAFITTSVLLPGIAYLSSPWYVVMVNLSDSLPGNVFLLDKTTSPTCHAFTAFDMPIEARFYRGSRLIKQIRGCAGDTITVSNDRIYINNIDVGVAMSETTNKAYALYPIAPGVVPEGKVYLSSTHVKSYDSRYASFGLRDEPELLGTAYLLF